MAATLKESGTFTVPEISTANPQRLAGWNPIVDPDFKLQRIRPKALQREIFLTEAIDFAYGKKKLSKKSRFCYQSMLNFIKETRGKKRIGFMPS